MLYRCGIVDKTDHGHGHGHDHDHDDDCGHDHDHHGHDHHGHDHHGHDHDHHGHDHHHHDLREASRKSLITAVTLTTTFMVIEVIGGFASGSLALISDAGHMLTDSAAIGLALFAMWAADRAASAKRTFGFYRTEILAAMFNALSLWVIVGWIFFEAIRRFDGDTHVEGGLMLGVGAAGLLINVLVAWVLHRQSGHSLNVEGAFQHVLADLLGSVAVVISGIFIISVGWDIVDPILSMFIGVLILFSSWNLVSEVFHVLIDGTPENVDVYKLCHDIEEVEGVTIVHDVHVRTISSGYLSMTAHVLTEPSSDAQEADDKLRRIREIVKGYGIQHTTIQLEHSVEGCDQESHHVDHLFATEREIRQKSKLTKFLMHSH